MAYNGSKDYPSTLPESGYANYNDTVFTGKVATSPAALLTVSEAARALDRIESSL